MALETLLALFQNPHQWISLLAAMVVLIAYVANLIHWLDSDGAWYAAMNAGGSGVLTYLALEGSPAGIILMEGLWTVFSLYAFFRAIIRPVSKDPEPIA